MPEDILKDDVKVLREEQDELFRKSIKELAAIQREIELRITQGKEAGFNTEAW